jgi:hypothetical protein
MVRIGWRTGLRRCFPPWFDDGPSQGLETPPLPASFHVSAPFHMEAWIPPLTSTSRGGDGPSAPPFLLYREAAVGEFSHHPLRNDATDRRPAADAFRSWDSTVQPRIFSAEDDEGHVWPSRKPPVHGTTSNQARDTALLNYLNHESNGSYTRSRLCAGEGAIGEVYLPT